MATSQPTRRKAPVTTGTDDRTAAPAGDESTSAPARRRRPRSMADTERPDTAAATAPAAKTPRARAPARRPREAPVAAAPMPAPAEDALPAVASHCLPPAEDTALAVLAVLGESRSARRALEPDAAAGPAEPTDLSGPADSEIVLIDGDRRQLAWRPGHACPPLLRRAAQQRLDATGHLRPEDDAALPTLLRLAAEGHHRLRVDEAVWPHLAAHRDARTRLQRLAQAYPEGPASAAFATLLHSPLPLFQAEGALFAVVAGRALIADERGLGKTVQAIAAAQLWQRHFGVRRVLVLCSADRRAGWRRAWLRFAGAADAEAPEVMAGGLHHRQSLWARPAGVRILSPEALDSDAAYLAQWAPDLVIVDEPQQLGLRDAAWRALAAPQTLVLCGAALAEQPALMQAIVGWLDEQRLGPLAALNELQAASEAGQAIAGADVERLTDQLSRLMIQRLRAELYEQLPPVVHSERLLPLAPAQREAHDRHLAQARRIVDGWQGSGYLSDGDQWSLSLALRSMQRAAHRADPADDHGALAEATLQAMQAQLDDWAATGAPRVAVLCPEVADLAALAQRLGERGALAATDANGQPLVQLLAPGDPLPAGVDAVLQVGVPWRPRRAPGGPRDEAAAGQQWLYLVAQDSVDTGLFDTLALRQDAPRGLADGGARDYLQGERLTDWLRLIQAVLAATEAGR